MKLSFSSILFLFPFFLPFFLSFFFIIIVILYTQNRTAASFFFHHDSKMRYANVCIYIRMYVCTCVTRVSQYLGGRRRSFFVEGIFQLEASMRFIASRKTRCKKGDHWWKGLLFESLKRRGGYMDVDFGFFLNWWIRLCIYLSLKRVMVEWSSCFAGFEFLKGSPGIFGLHFFFCLQY